ncbi:MULTISPECIES: transposase [unclassified Synechococcus]|uniref:transposase n=1 Tax=unclassified Synechococcus TaxID=2626047 RepID=UPI0020CBED8C|nr:MULTISPECIES: transposase [unclassified Synechococcus]
MLQQLFNLSDEELEFQVNDIRSFQEFVGLGVMNSIPDATTIAFFRSCPSRVMICEGVTGFWFKVLPPKHFITAPREKGRSLYSLIQICFSMS